MKLVGGVGGWGLGLVDPHTRKHALLGVSPNFLNPWWRDYLYI